VGMFELEIWIFAGCTLVVTLAGLLDDFSKHEGLFTVATGGAVFLILVGISARYRVHVVRIQTFIESLPLDIWMSDERGRCILQSGESYKLMGNMIGKTPDELGLPSAALAEWNANTARVLNGETVYKEGMLIVDGKPRDIFTIMTPVTNQDKFIGSVRVNLNITERKKTERHLQRTADQLSMLNDIARAITTIGNLDSVLNLIRAQAQRILPIDMFMVLLYQPETNMVSYPLVYDNGRNWEQPDQELSLDMRSYEVIQTGKSLLVNLTEEEFEKLSKNKDRTLIGDRNATYRSFIYAPLVGQGGVIGVISAINYKFNAYNHKHLELLESFALQATIAIENARLFQAQQKELAERKQAEDETRKLNAELEERVERRTLQLQEANSNLTVEKSLLEKYNNQRKVMADMTDMLQASLSTQEASGVISTHLRILFPQMDGALYLLNESGMFESAANWGRHPSPNSLYTANDCWALRRGKPYRFEIDQHNPSCVHFGNDVPRHALCIPLLAQGESLGNLHISTDGEQNLMGIEEQQSLQTAADSIALALANLRLREKLRVQSIHDSLTGVYNRRYLDEILPREVHRAGRGNYPLSVLLLDIDLFKKFNDTHGHAAGDFVLKNVARILLSFIRESDIACRYGGEEFVIIMPDTSIETAHNRAETLRHEIERNELVYDDVFLGAITISVGVAAYPQHGKEQDALVKAADEALYQAKQSGRNRVMIKT
jgi:diguanylate cyclase (GGDEF)-like protein